MGIDIILLFVLAYGLYLGYTQGVFRVSLIALTTVFALLLSMYLTSPSSEYLSNFFGFHHKLLPLLVFLFIVLLFAFLAVLIYKKIEKKLKNTQNGKIEKYLGALTMAIFFSFLYSVLLNFFSVSNALKKENKENSFTYTILENFSESGMTQIKKLAPFVNTFIKSLSDDSRKDKNNQEE